MASTFEQYSTPHEQVHYLNNTGTGVGANITVGQVMVDTAKRNHTVMLASVMFGSGVLGNLLALFVLATSSVEQRRTLFYKLVAGLAVTDLFGTCTTSPVVISVYVNNFQWVGGAPLCQYFSFMMIFASITTMFIVCAMSIERYICVRHPYLYHTRLTATYAKITLGGSWLLAFVIAAFPLVGLGKNVLQYPGTWCFFDYTGHEPQNKAFNYMYAIIALCAVVITMGCNVAVIYTLMRLRRKQGLLNASNGSTRTYRGNNKRYAEIQMVVLLIGITVVFTSCYSPMMIYVLLCQTELVNLFNTKMAMIQMVRLASFNQILDPWVYILFRRELVWKVINLIRCIFCVQSKPESFDPAQMKRQDAEEASCLNFCLHCLCEPPNSRGLNYSVSRPSMSFTRSPSYSRRLSDTIYGNGTVSAKLIIKPPSPADEMILKSYRATRTQI